MIRKERSSESSIAAARKDIEHSVPAMRRDAFLLPILACAPAAGVLFVMQQRSYQPDSLILFRLSAVPIIIYVCVRYIIPKRRKIGA